MTTFYKKKFQGILIVIVSTIFCWTFWMMIFSKHIIVHNLFIDFTKKPALMVNTNKDKRFIKYITNYTRLRNKYNDSDSVINFGVITINSQQNIRNKYVWLQEMMNRMEFEHVYHKLWLKHLTIVTQVTNDKVPFSRSQLRNIGFLQMCNYNITNNTCGTDLDWVCFIDIDTYPTNKTSLSPKSDKRNAIHPCRAIKGYCDGFINGCQGILNPCLY